ncbi:hypothetical protein P8452_12478 [Trifolium repens]|nr:hypothetical protein P8452_12478 [Trifolium repens]
MYWGTSVVKLGCGVILETEGHTNTFITSLNLIRKSEGEGGVLVDNNVVENVKVIICADDDNFYVAEVCGCDYFYNLSILRFKSRTTLRPATVAMIDMLDLREMRHPSYGFEARRKLQKIFPNVLSVPNGLIIKNVFEGYNAESAGLKVDDVILSCDGSQIKSFLETCYEWNN